MCDRLFEIGSLAVVFFAALLATAYGASTEGTGGYVWILFSPLLWTKAIVSDSRSSITYNRSADIDEPIAVYPIVDEPLTMNPGERREQTTF